jgi:hypothetical protein
MAGILKDFVFNPANRVRVSRIVTAPDYGMRH